MKTFAPRGNISGPIVPHYILGTDMSLGAKLMYAILCNYAGRQDYCWPSQARLAERLHCSVSSVKQYLAELVSNKLIHILRTPARVSKYYILQPETLTSTEQSCSTSSIQQSEYTHYQSESGYVSKKYKNITNNPQPPLPPTGAPKTNACLYSSCKNVGGRGSLPADGDFEQLWAAYPKKEAKGTALWVWEQLRSQGSLPALSEMLKSIDNFNGSDNWHRERGRFIPHLSNWLRGFRWLETPAKDNPQGEPHSSDAPTPQEIARAVQLKQAEAAEAEKRKARREALRPAFEAFIAKFSTPLEDKNRSMAFGIWNYLHDRYGGMMPSMLAQSDVDGMSVCSFLRKIQIQCQGQA